MTSLEERIALFKHARATCREHIQEWKDCAREHGNALAPQCRQSFLKQNLCQGQFFCPDLASRAVRGGVQEGLDLDSCCKAFLAQLKSDHKAAKAAR